MKCAVCGAESGELAVYCSSCARPLTGAVDAQGGARVGGIPHNPHALAACYLGIFSVFLSILPTLGLPVGVVSVILGTMGLKRREEDPRIRGAAPAWIGIGCGSLSVLVWGTVIVLMVVTVAID